MHIKQLYIDGAWQPAAAGGQRAIVDPGTGETIARVSYGTTADAEHAIRAARTAFDHGEWPRRPAGERAACVRALADALRGEASALARIETANTGKTLAESASDVHDAAAAFDYFTSLAVTESGSVNATQPHALSVTLREPVGVCGLITPWNYPLLQAAWKLAPALVAGNTVVIKPASLTPLSTHRLVELAHDAGLPRGVLNLVTGGADVGDTLASSAEVDLISLTGSNAAGASVMRAAASNFKRVSLELGGKNPNIVFADADFDTALDYALNAAFFNAGQMCSAGSRLLVERALHDRFVDALAERIAAIRLGHGVDEATRMGPVISAQQRDRVLALIGDAAREGARIVCGGRAPAGDAFATGFWIEPTLIADVRTTMAIARDEVFGPVLTVETFDSEDDALALANDTPFGLAGAVWTRDFARANRVMRRLRAATVWVNDYNVTLPGAPWGGYKASGIGRELSRSGLDEYTELKHAYVNFEASPQRWF
ncbi:aldehyde dehydrogenase family protein [Burkholderia anthina]|uniref:Aldehyde dehydrogenase family protein n=1 Tax=Burkholderia anthina TaxID=179879 RepID=A0A6P2GGX2_9BURK|nr:aldehyde dehydrogenase family protein [Burkholderia anthina]MBM2767802.1 aldehyde dehydrogenase family protein [Burkholderia anthina]VVU53023.1 betaine-aldehyde dehydrogenase [Burkholderia anthina]